MKRQCHFSHNKCWKITIKHWKLDLFFILHFTYLEGVRTHPTHPPAYGPDDESFHNKSTRRRHHASFCETFDVSSHTTRHPHHESFYRAMLYIRGTSHGPVSVCPSVCLSVCLSVTSRCSTKTAKRRITQATPHDSAGTLVSWCQRSPRNSTGVTPYEGAECRWGGSKSATFDQ